MEVSLWSVNNTVLQLSKSNPIKRLKEPDVVMRGSFASMMDKITIHCSLNRTNLLEISLCLWNVPIVTKEKRVNKKIIPQTYKTSCLICNFCAIFTHVQLICVHPGSAQAITKSSSSFKPTQPQQAAQHQTLSPAYITDRHVSMVKWWKMDLLERRSMCNFSSFTCLFYKVLFSLPVSHWALK